jgi:hypothetical protein
MDTGWASVRPDPGLDETIDYKSQENV